MDMRLDGELIFTGDIRKADGEILGSVDTFGDVSID